MEDRVYIENIYNDDLRDYPFSLTLSSTCVSEYTPTPVVIPDNEIWYKTSSGELLDKDFEDTSYFGEDLSLVSHTYEDGIGRVVFDGNVTSFIIASDSESLKEIFIPSKVTSLWGILGGTNLEAIHITSTTPPTTSDDPEPFGDSTCPIYVPSSSLESYKSAEIWSEYYKDRLRGE